MCWHKGSPPVFLLGLQKMPCAGDDVTAFACPVHMSRGLWLSRSERSYQTKHLNTRRLMEPRLFSAVVVNKSRPCLSVDYENGAPPPPPQQPPPPLLCRPRFTDPVRLASGSLSVSASRPGQWKTGTRMSKHCLPLPRSIARQHAARHCCTITLSSTKCAFMQDVIYHIIRS